MKRVISFFLVACLLISIVAHCPISASATEVVPDGYIGIYNADDLNAVRNNLAGNYILMNDIDLSSVGNWLPIGGEYQEDGFSGVLDGNGHAILNMNVDADSVELDYVGLFSILNGATIKNIKAITGRIYSENTAFLSAGAVAGMAYGSNIAGCASYVEISYQWGEPTGEVFTTAFDVCFDGGGIAGCIYENTVITECCNYGSIKGISRSAPISIGGIAGVAGFPNAEITDCFNSASLSLNTGFSNAEIGGIVGSSLDIAINRCYNAGQLACKAGELDYIGGIIGDVNNSPSNSIVDCYYNTTSDVAVGCVPILKDRDVEIYINISAESLNTALMQERSSFIGFDFLSIWRMGDKEYPFPILRTIGDYLPNINADNNEGNLTNCDHTWGSGAVTKEATCKEPGIKTFTCTKCSNTKTESIAKLTTHSYKSGWSKDGTNHWHECSVCQNKKDLAAHTPGAAATETTAQTCTTCGYVIREAVEGTQGGKVIKKVIAYSSTQEDGFWLQLLDVDGTAYILDIDATLVAPYDEVQFTPNGATYVYGKHTVKYTGNIETYNGGEYYNLQELMNLLNVRYDYVAESQTIMFNSAISYKENLIEDCDSIYADYYGLDYLDNPAYYGLGAAYNIIGGFRIDFLWGNYQTEMREEVVVNIMAADQNAESFVDLLNKGDSFAKKAITVYKGLNDATSGIERYSDLLDCPEAEWLKAYDKVSKGGGVFGFSDFLDIAQLAYDAQGAYSTYATAVKYGLVKNNNMKYIGDDCLKTAANNVYSYYEQETHVFSDMFADTVKTAGNNITTKAVKDIIKRGTGYKGNITKLVKLFADEALQMKEMTTAVEHTHICATIQEAAMLQYKASNDPLTKKYCTILYLRACQYAYSLYEFDPTLSWSAEYWKDKTQQAIETLVVYSDAELSRTVTNDRLDMMQEGFMVISDVQN